MANFVFKKCLVNTLARMAVIERKKRVMRLVKAKFASR